MNISPRLRIALTIALIGAILYGTALLLFRLLKRSKKTSSASLHAASAADTSSSRTSSSNLVTFPLKFGSDTRQANLDCVYNLQFVANEYGASIATDGIWGPHTEEAVNLLHSLSQFAPHISPVQNPSDGRSHWQITSLNDYNAIVRTRNQEKASK